MTTTKNRLLLKWWSPDCPTKPDDRWNHNHMHCTNYRSLTPEWHFGSMFGCRRRLGCQKYHYDCLTMLARTGSSLTMCPCRTQQEQRHRNLRHLSKTKRIELLRHKMKTERHYYSLCHVLPVKLSLTLTMTLMATSVPRSVFTLNSVVAPRVINADVEEDKSICDVSVCI